MGFCCKGVCGERGGGGEGGEGGGILLRGCVRVCVREEDISIVIHSQSACHRSSRHRIRGSVGQSIRVTCHHRSHYLRRAGVDNTQGVRVRLTRKR